MQAPDAHVWPCGQLVAVQAQAPPEQAGVAPAQALPQVPQLAASVAVSTHVAPQTTWPPGQAHDPAWQVVPPVQALPQAPQLAALVCRSTQAPPQLVRPAAQQTPPWQVWPLAHAAPAPQVHVPPVQVSDVPVQALPQAPQSAALVCVSTQAPLQATWPAGQQMPAEQTSVPAQAAPVPQVQAPAVQASPCAPQSPAVQQSPVGMQPAPQAV